MDSVEAKVSEWKRKLPNKRKITSSLDQFLQQKSISLLYTPAEQDRIHEVTKLISEATCEYEAQEDWERIIRVVDALEATSSHAVLKEAIRYLKIRLGDPSLRVVILSLVLTESIVKNCGRSVHTHIGTLSFLSQLEELYKEHHEKCGRNSMEITERVLDMIQSWGEAFLPYRNRLPMFTEVYHNMRKRGVKFPKQYDENRVPVISVEDPFEPRGQDRDRDNTHQNDWMRRHNVSDEVYDRMKQMTDAEAFLLAKNVAEMFEDVIFAAKRETDNIVAEGGVIMELAEQAAAFAKRMESMIQTAVTQDIGEDLERYLAVNDALTQALSDYEKLRQRTSFPEQSKQIEDNQDEEDLFADFVKQRIGSKEDQQENQDEEDPFESFVKERSSKSIEQKEVLDLIDFSDIPISNTTSPPMELEMFANTSETRKTPSLPPTPSISFPLPPDPSFPSATNNTIYEVTLSPILSNANDFKM